MNDVTREQLIDILLEIDWRRRIGEVADRILERIARLPASAERNEYQLFHDDCESPFKGIIVGAFNEMHCSECGKPVVVTVKTRT